MEFNHIRMFDEAFEDEIIYEQLIGHNENRVFPKRIDMFTYLSESKFKQRYRQVFS